MSETNTEYCSSLTFDLTKKLMQELNRRDSRGLLSIDIEKIRDLRRRIFMLQNNDEKIEFCCIEKNKQIEGK